MALLTAEAEARCASQLAEADTRVAALNATVSQQQAAAAAASVKVEALTVQCGAAEASLQRALADVAEKSAAVAAVTTQLDEVRAALAAEVQKHAATVAELHRY